LRDSEKLHQPGTVSYGEAAARCSDLAQRQFHKLNARPIETVLLDAGLGRVLSEPVRADRDQPPFARSTRDGFAGQAEDWNRGSLQVDGLLAAGEQWAAPLEPGHCVEIMTGAPVPEGADCVAMVEHIDRTATQVRLRAGRMMNAGENVVPRGAEAAMGKALLDVGTVVRPQGIAVCAACGYGQLHVYTQATVGILATGNELVAVAATPAVQQIRNSNAHALAALVRSCGGQPVMYAPVPDDERALREAILDASQTCDIVLLTGGVSMGKYDLVEPALLSLGGHFLFTGASIQPGKPVVCGEMMESGIPFFGLPGNPVSTMVCFHLFVAPVLAALNGRRDYMPAFVGARLQIATRGKPGLTQFLPAQIRPTIEGAEVEAIAWQGSGDVASAARANCFLVIPEDAHALSAGDQVTVLLA
jgi:molybdopterin molybdotransferase